MSIQFTKEQYVTEIGEFYWNDDLPFEDDDMFKVFNTLSNYLKGKILMWGFSDTEVREELYEYFLKNQFDMTPYQYYESDIATNYFKHKIKVKFDFKKASKK
tara:strand:+ start:8792 stop:9097 length:306 start_codon:yes stop_codon:yes gene_type:complete